LRDTVGVTSTASLTVRIQGDKTPVVSIQTANGLGSLFSLTLPTRTLADFDFGRYSHYSATAADGSRLLLGAFCSQIVHQRPTGAQTERVFAQRESPKQQRVA
jgi:hypothetical protein